MIVLLKLRTLKLSYNYLSDYRLQEFQHQSWELGKKYDGNFIFTFVIVKVRYSSITTVKIFKHGNYLPYFVDKCL